MSLFGWALVFIGLGLAALGVLALVVRRLWRGFKALGRDAARAADAVSRIGTAATAATARTVSDHE